MKKIPLLAVLAVGAVAAHAQGIAAGTVLLGGGIGYYQSDNAAAGSNSSSGGYNPFTYQDTFYQFSVAPAAGYFVADNLALGVVANYSTAHSKQEVTNNQPSHYVSTYVHDPSTMLSVGVFAQYYKLFGSQLGLTGQVSASYFRSKERSHGTDDLSGRSSSSEASGAGYTANLTPALIFFPVARLGLSASVGSLGFNHSRLRSSYFATDSAGNHNAGESDGTTNNFGASFGLDRLILGGAYYFGRK